MPKRRHDAIGDDRLEIVRDVREGIEADRTFEVVRVDVHQVVRPGARNVFERGLSEVAMRIKESKPLPGREVLANEVQEKGALAGSGLPNDVEVPPSLLLVEHDIIAQRMGTDAELLAWCIHGRKGAGVPCAPQFGIWCGQHPHSV